MIFINKTQIYLCEFQTPTAHNFFSDKQISIISHEKNWL